MKLLTKEQRKKLLANGRNRARDHRPVVKLFDPYGPARWLFNELDEDEDTLFGLCDLGFNFPEVGYASLAEIAAIRIPIRSAPGIKFRIERDLDFEAKGPLSMYADAARAAGRIVEFGPEFEAAMNDYMANAAAA